MLIMWIGSVICWLVVRVSVSLIIGVVCCVMCWVFLCCWLIVSWVLCVCCRVFVCWCVCLMWLWLMCGNLYGMFR